MLAFYMWAFGMLQRVLLVVSLTRGGIGAALVSLMCPATQSRDTFFCTSVRPSQAYRLRPQRPRCLRTSWSRGQELASSRRVRRCKAASQSPAKAGSDREWVARLHGQYSTMNT
jgi:hypothetical protein